MSLNPILIYNKFLKIRHEGMKKLAEEMEIQGEKRAQAIAALSIRQMMVTEFQGWEVLSPERANSFNIECADMRDSLKQIWSYMNEGKIPPQNLIIDVAPSLVELEERLLWYVKNRLIFGDELATLYAILYWFTTGPLIEFQDQGYPDEIKAQFRKYNMAVDRMVVLLNSEIIDYERCWMEMMEKVKEDIDKWGWKYGMQKPVYMRGKNSGGG